MTVGTTDTMDTTADPGVTFDLPSEGTAPPPPRNYGQQVNIAPQLTLDEQKAFAKQVIETTDRDWDGGKDFRARRTKQVELFAGIMPEKPAGHEKIAQIHLSIIAQAVLVLHATIHGQLFPPTNYIYGARAVTPHANDRVRRLGLHMNWQVTTRITEYLPANDKGMMQWLIYGTAFDYWYYNPIERRPCYEFIRTDDLVMPYTRNGVRYDLSDVPHFTIKQRKYQHEIEQLVDVGYFDSANAQRMFGEGQNAGTLVPSEKSPSGEPMQKTEDKIQGQKEPTEDPNGPRLLYMHHCWYKLPGETRQRAVIATVDRDTQTLLRLILREGDDPRDRARYNREKTANEAAHAAQMAQHDQAMQDHTAMVQDMTTPKPVTDEMGMPVVHPMTGEPQMLPPAPPEAIPQPPTPPEPPAEPAQVRQIAEHWVTKYGCIPNPEGAYDFGVGYLLEGDNVAADTLMSQYVSALTLALFPTFLYSKQAKMQRGDLTLRMGEGQEVGLPPGQMQQAFYQFQFPQPGPAVPKLIQQREEAGRQLVGASSILTGDAGEANETATAAQLRNSAARMNLAEMGNRFNRARANSMKNLARINAVTLDPVEYFGVTMPGNQDLPPEQMDVARDDYLEDFEITFQSDPRLASQPQRVQDALGLLQQLMAVAAIPGLINPQAMQMAVTMALVQYLKALDRDDAANIILQSAPPPPPPMQGGPGQAGGPPQPPGQPGKPTPPGAAHGKPGEAPGDVRGPEPGPPEGVGIPPGNATLPTAA